jgi:hypothetical protein
MDMDISHSLMKENASSASTNSQSQHQSGQQQQKQLPCSPSPSKEHYNAKLAHQLFDGKQPKGRIDFFFFFFSNRCWIEKLNNKKLNINYRCKSISI